ncbi:MAG TPA: hypothetical protein PKJ07_01630 [Bacteroidales bacterium]|jgi:hypothetical protein|nr:hypothetical protein [Bacteroidales bacterium]HOB26830.1 hypothetical protein [Bacteroidales bacterium]HOK21457.1 hypothetical protein [Bacteroidales bacterium]HOL74849.1 hypothetical protein [Bacteroidales bacterium]HPU46098.1 hypothetical protein [Bacteroidales bacterium]
MKKLFFLILINLLFINLNFTQSGFKMVEKQMVEYKLSDSFRELIIKYVIDNIPIKNAYFVVNVDEYDDRCSISIEYCQELNDKDLKYIGFFEIDNKLFFVINGHKDFLYPTDSIKEVEYRQYIKKEQVKNDILYLEPYEDDVPVWYFVYKDGEFNLTYYSNKY